MNFTTTHIRSEKVTIDTRIYTILNGRKKPGEVYLAAIAPDMELTIITLDEAPGILPCFEEDDACLNLPNTSLLLCYNPAQVLKPPINTVGRKMPLQRSRLQALPPKPYLHQTNPYPIMSFFPTRI